MELDSCLAHGVRPCNSACRFDADARREKIKSQADFLSRLQWRNRLNSRPGFR
jgi:hypothetical protein